MRRINVVVTLAVLTSALSMAPASAAGCPSKASRFASYPINGSIGDPAPAPGVEPLWDLIIAGGAQEGFTVEELAASIGLDVDGLYSFVLAAWSGLDKNGDRTVCLKPFPEQGRGMPAYFFNGIDNNAAAAPTG